VVGVGHIGSRVVRLAKSLGMKVLRNDPPLQRLYKDDNFISLEEILQADIITLHVPLSFEGNDKTFHLLNENNFKRIKRGAIIINTSRGGVVDNSALLTESISREFDLVLDVWEDEPRVNPELLNKTKIATPHIAGYSFEGKVKGTKMIYNALCKFLDVKPSWRPDIPKIQDKEMRLSEGKSDEEKLYRLFSSIYDIEKDDEVMSKLLTYEPNERAKYFELLRKKYPVRREFSNYSVQISENDIHLKSFLENFRFTVVMI
jgi:erythronate-4-phosphate dehydrogenase